MNTQYIELNDLVKSPLNARKTTSKAAADDLKSSILAHGLMQNLVVVPADKGYHVIAGARRLAAMKALQAEGKLPVDHVVPCQVATDEHALEMSLAENTVRAAMHPADEFEAFAELNRTGRSVGFIAERFGVTEKHVWQRLKLGRVAPELMAEYRAEEIDLECLMAFTITDDRKRQMDVYQSLQGWQKGNARHIRGCLTDAMVRSTDKLAKFVGLDAYQAAGGKVKADLFGEEVYLEDAALLNRLAGEKLDAEAVTLRQEGWGWVEVGELDYSTRSKYGRIESVPLDAPAELVAELEAAEAEQLRVAKLIDAAHEEEDLDQAVLEGLEAQDSAISEKIGTIEEQLASYIGFDPEQMKSAGCFVSINYHGQVDIEKGLVRAEDKKAVTKASSEDPGSDQADETPNLSQALKTDLEAYRLGAAQTEIARHPAIAFDLLVFKVAKSALTVRSSYDGPDVSFTRNYAGTASKDARQFVTDQMKPLAESLPVGWLKPEAEAEQFLAFRELPQPQKHILLAYCVAVTLRPKLDGGKEPTAYDVALALTGANLADYWRPTKENFLSRITKGQLLEIGGKLLGASWATHRRESKKAQLAEQLHEAFEDPLKHGKTPEQVERLDNWLPEGMAFPPMPEPEPAKAKKGKTA